MELPTAYLTTAKNLSGILEAMKGAKAPDRFTQKFLVGLGFESRGNRLVISVLKALGLLDDGGAPTQRYYEFVDRDESERVLSMAIREAYADLFEVNTSAQTMSTGEVANKIKTLTQGQYLDTVVRKMASTFKALTALADFSAPPSEAARAAEAETVSAGETDADAPTDGQRARSLPGVKLDGLAYNIHINLPDSRDPAVFNAIFRSMKEHLFS